MQRIQRTLLSCLIFRAVAESDYSQYSDKKGSSDADGDSQRDLFLRGHALLLPAIQGDAAGSNGAVGSTERVRK